VTARGKLNPAEIARRHSALMAHCALTRRNFQVVSKRGGDERRCRDDAVCAQADAPTQAACAPGVHQVVSYAEAWRWAADEGLVRRRQALDLKAVNAARKRQGLLPFALKGAA
jgi:hypothetical protein